MVYRVDVTTLNDVEVIEWNDSIHAVLMSLG